MNNVYNGQGVRLGYHTSENQNQVYAYDKSGTNIGYYNKSSNTTFDKNGRRYGVGNLVKSLILNSQNS
jgi:hypothetical protein